MKVCIRNLLQPAHFVAFVFGICPYRRSDESPYRRSKLGTILQLTNVILTTSSCVYVVLFHLPEAIGTRNEYSSPRARARLIIQMSQIFLSLWLILHQFIFASKTLRCLRLADELNTTICRMSNLKQYPIAFYAGIVWAAFLFVKFPGNETMGITTFVATISINYCETLVLEFVTVVCLAVDTVNQKLQSWQTNRNYNMNDLKRLQSLYLKAAHLAEVVDNAFGTNWLLSLFSKSIHVVLTGNWVFKGLVAAVAFLDEKISFDHNMLLAYLTFRLATGISSCFYIYYYLHQPTVKRLKTVSILRVLISRNSDDDILLSLNDFTLQVALRKMRFSAEGFFDINLDHFSEVVGTWFTLLVIIVQVTNL